MSLPFPETLTSLERLGPRKLHLTSLRIRRDYGSYEWKLAMCLLAMVRTMAFRALKFANISEYAERALHISGRKAGELLAAARVLEHHPALSAAFQAGTLCWSKLRAIQTLVTPETEVLWLEFARTRRTSEIERMVALSPSSWKRKRALEAFLAGHPNATADNVAEFLSRPEVKAPPPQQISGPGDSPWSTQSDGSSGVGRDYGEANGHDGSPAAGQLLGAAGFSAEAPEPSAAPLGLPSSKAKSRFETGSNALAQSGAPPRDELGETDAIACGAGHALCPAGGSRDDKEGTHQMVSSGLPGDVSPRIRVVAFMTADEYALFDAAESRIRASHGRRLRLGTVLAQMSESVLNAGTARARARHLVIVHRNEETNTAWYETSRGVLPVAPEMREIIEGTAITIASEAIRPEAPALKIAGAATESDGQGESPSTVRCRTRREGVPVAVLRALFGRANNCCEACGRYGGRLHVHHRCPVSEGGGNALEDLELRCESCHTLVHEPDYASKPSWASARAARTAGEASRPAPR